MKGIEVKRTARVSLDLDADRWELFDEPGRDEAAADLTRTLQDAVNAPGSTRDSVYAAMAPLQRRYGDLGADDGEAQDLIDRVVNTAFD